MITKRETTLAELTKKLLPETQLFNSPAGREVGSLEKFKEDRLNGIGHICNCIAYGHDGIKKVIIYGYKENNLNPVEKAQIIIKNAGKGRLEIEVYAGKLPDSFEPKAANYIMQKSEEAGTLELFQSDARRYVTHERIRDNVGTEKDDAQEIELFTFPKGPLDQDSNLTMLIDSKSWHPGYLIKDILQFAGVSASGDGIVEIFTEKSAKERSYDMFLIAAQHASVPVDFACGLLLKVGIDLTFHEDKHP